MAITRFTLADLRTQLRERIGATEGLALFWTDYDLDVCLREATRTWNLLTGQWRGRVVLATVASSPFLTLPSTLTWAARLEWLGVPLEPTSLLQLDDAVTGWQSMTAGTPQFWAPVSLRLVALAPPPSTAQTSLVVDGILQTPTLASDTATIDLDIALVPVILDYAKHLGTFRLGGDVWAASQPARQAFWRAAGDQNQRLQATTLYARTIGLREESRVKPFRAGPSTVGWKPDLTETSA